MQCQICHKNEATIHLTEINEGVRSELHICESCALEQGIAVKSHMPVNELLSSLLSSQPSEDDMGGSQKHESCPVCGFSLDQLRNEAVLGCPHDYEFFKSFLLPIIEKAHDGHTIHRGKVPARAPEDSKNQMELLNLRKQLESSVRAEDYEQAARIRDRISEIE